MPLNIYIISHPIITILSTQIIYSLSKNNKINEPIYDEINFLLIYELLRKWIKVTNIYIKDINQIKEISIFNPKESYTLFTNLEKCYNIINHLKILIPKLSLIHINTCKDKNNNAKIYFNSNQEQYLRNNKIIIVEKILNNNSIINFVNELINDYKIHITSIKIICIVCNKKVLEVINKKYSNLEIYTTKIINI
uniref:uracil phosphoribosyltransferase n=1 Tax=Hypnea cervicornis TaxID=387623 RepID=UPI0021B664EF|nr:uracil phosphoribosyltransferase [Hypnea cervicornis]UVW80638.1 uracil phosphoribosyltransferase [Hypnea cervicornis]